MSSNSLAMFRRSMGNDLGELAEEHYRHDLQESDRAALQSAAGKLSTFASAGSVLGLGLGLFAASRLRRNRVALFNAFRATEKPTEVRFANGRSEPIPDLTSMVKPSTVGDVLTYSLFGLGGLFLGGEVGVLAGASSAKRTIAADAQSRARIETAFRRFRADSLRAEATKLEQGVGSIGF